MKTVYSILVASLLTTSVSAKTYVVGSGKWNDARVWDSQYPGTVVKAGDVVIISGQVTVTEGILVEGTLKVEKGAAMIGMRDLVITKSGRFENNGNTVMKRIVNEGTINNNLIMEAMLDFDNKGKIENNNNIVAGNNFTNYGGHPAGNNGAYYINNTVSTSPTAPFGKDVNVFYGSVIENEGLVSNPSSTMLLTASLHPGKGVELSISNPGKKVISQFSIEKSTDGHTYQLLETVSNTGKNGEAELNYTDTKINDNLTYYKVKALDPNGEETVLPVASVKAGVSPVALTSETE